MKTQQTYTKGERGNDVSIIVPNVHEYAQKGMDPNYPDLLLAQWRNKASGFADAAIFWEGDDKLVVSPRPILEPFVEYIQGLLGYKNIVVATPHRYSTSLSLDILHDESVLSVISNYIGSTSSNGVALSV